MVTLVLGAGLSLVYLQAETEPGQDITQVQMVLGAVFSLCR